MLVRDEDDTARPRPATADRLSSQENDPQPRRDQRLGNWILGGLVAVLVTGVVLGVLGVRGQNNEADLMFAPTADPTALPVGEAAQNAGATEDFAGVAVGFPQSVDGAVSAMMTYGNAAGAALFRTPQERAEIANRIFTDEGRAASGLTDEAAAETQERLGVNQAGIAEREDGSLDPARTAFAECAYEFGAYRVHSVGRHTVASPEPGEPGQLPFEVVVTTWSPCLSGVGGAQDVSEVKVRWTHQTSTMRWERGDWRVDSTIHPDGRTPAPADPDDVAVTFDERARLLGKDWTLPADATEEIGPAFWARGTR